MQSLPQPAAGGSINQLRTFLNVGGDNNWILCVSWLVAACRAKGPFPILILQGEQGSAKSTMVKLLRRIIDPSSALVRTPPRDSRDLLIAARNSWVVAYDNVSGVSPGLSDSLCRLATGGGFSTRELYTDSDEVFFDAVRPVVLNGIDHLAERADLADRALTLNLSPIPDENRRDEGQLYADFDRQLPQILGALFSAVSVALARLPQTKLDSKPRMADFALWASAAEAAFGFPPGVFMKAYTGNRAEAVHETLEADPVGTEILALVDSREGEAWEGTCKQLLQDLEQHVDDGVKKSRDWPKSPRGLSSRLRRLVTFLRELQIRITFHTRGTNGQRTVTISRAEPHSTATSATTANPGSDGSSGQMDTAEQPGGGRASEVASQACQDRQPPPESSPANSLKGTGSDTVEAEVAEVTIDCEGVPSDREHTVAASDPINLCARCGPVCWEWMSGEWVCPVCLAPARSQSTSSVRERIVL